MTLEEELTMARETAEYCKERLRRARAEHHFWRDQLKRQQLKAASLLRQVAR